MVWRRGEWTKCLKNDQHQLTNKRGLLRRLPHEFLFTGKFKKITEPQQWNDFFMQLSQNIPLYGSKYLWLSLTWGKKKTSRLFSHRLRLIKMFSLKTWGNISILPRKFLGLSWKLLSAMTNYWISYLLKIVIRYWFYHCQGILLRLLFSKFIVDIILRN